MINSCHCTSNGAVTKQHCLCLRCIESHFSSSFPSQSATFWQSLNSLVLFRAGICEWEVSRLPWMCEMCYGGVVASKRQQLFRVGQAHPEHRNACQDNALVVALPRHNEALRETHSPKWHIWTLKFSHGVLHRHVKDPELSNLVLGWPGRTWISSHPSQSVLGVFTNAWGSREAGCPEELKNLHSPCVISGNLIEGLAFKPTAGF